MRGLAEAEEGDKIIVSDCDEILNVDGIVDNLDNPNWVLFCQELFYYFVNNKFVRAWTRPVMAPFNTFDSKPHDLRAFSRSKMYKRIQLKKWLYCNI